VGLSSSELVVLPVVVFLLVSMALDLGFLIWNVRGLNNRARRNSIRLFVEPLPVSLVSFQESKLALVTAALIAETLGPEFDGYAFLPADETRGGVLLAWKSSVLEVSSLHLGEFSISAEVRSLADNKRWVITSVYGPQLRPDKLRFLDELAQFGASISLPSHHQLSGSAGHAALGPPLHLE
jgi:exonuclease III